MIAREMTAVFLDEPHKMTVRKVPTPEPGPGEALVAIKSVGICGSDLHYYEHGRIGPFVVDRPIILGHECAGEVVGLGAGVTSVAVGDRVAVEPGLPCRKCSYCKTGHYNLCQTLTFMATPPDHGAFCEYICWPEDFLFRLPDGVTNEMGATIEPLAVGLHTVNLTKLRYGESVCILGAGPIGLLALASALAAGAGSVSVVDMLDSRLDFASTFGASRTVNAAREDVSELLRDSADVVMDCVGVEATVQQALDVAKPGGRVAWVGMGADVVQVPAMGVQAKELLITGVWRYANVYTTAVNLMAAGRLDTRPLITHRFDFPDQVEEAFQFASANRDIALKTMVNF